MYSIGKLCSQFNLSRSTLLYYESIGLLVASERTKGIKDSQAERLGIGIRTSASSCNCSRKTVRDVLERAELRGLSWPIPEEMDDNYKARIGISSRRLRNT